MFKFGRSLTVKMLPAVVACLLWVSPAAADFVIADDLIVDGSACIGFDCVNGEVFSFDTLRLKENNLRIKFDDTSVAASFPKNDWQLTANDSSNGGQSKFSIDDITGGRTPFTVEANAPSHSLYVDDGGRLGLGTSTPAVELEIVDGDTPVLRLKQDSSSGFDPQTWDVAGNETNFFVRDVTNGSTLPFRIRPGAPSSAIFVDSDGDVGMSTSSPAAALHVRRTNGTGRIQVEETLASGTTGSSLLRLVNNGDSIFELLDTTGGNMNGWSIRGRSTDFLITHPTTANTMFLNENGNLTVAGGFFAMGGTQLNVPDYVFEQGYRLMPLQELASFVATEKHLPGVAAAAEIQKNGLDMTEMQLKLLEKVEELTLYTIAQQKTSEAQQKTIDDLKSQLEELRSSSASAQAR